MKQYTLSPAKIARPRLNQVLYREKLFKKLDQHRGSPSIWINGPAGSGKTTLISSYIEKRDLSYLWYQLDPGDQDIATFFHYMGLAEQKYTSRKTTPLTVFSPEYAKGIPIFSKRYFETLYERIKKPSVLVLDNYHEVSVDCPLHDVIQEGINAVPEGINLIILSRAEPPANLIRARANNILRMISWRELRLEVKETYQMLELFGSRKYSDGEVHLLHEKVGGWLAGLLLILQASKHKGFHGRSFSNYTPEIIFDYFAEEILKNTDTISHDFLLTTAIFPNMTPQMAEKLTKVPQSDQILSRLNRENFFTDKKPAKSPTYQFHPLFREFLLAKCHKSFPPERLQSLKREAAHLLERNGQIEDAAALYSEVADYKKLTRLILCQSSSLLFQGRNQTLVEWINILPKETFNKEPWLIYWLAVSLINTDPNQSRDFFEQALSLFKKNKNTKGTLLSFCGVSDSIFQCFEQFDHFSKLIPRLEAFCGNLKSFPSPEIEARVTATMLLALCARQPFHPDLSSWKRQALLSLDKNIETGAKIQLLISILMCKIHAGELTETSHLLTIYRENARDGDVVPYALIVWKVLDSLFSWLDGHFEQCDKSYQEALELCLSTGIQNSYLFVLNNRAAGALSTGDLSLADELLGKLESQLDHYGAWEKRFFHIIATWRALLGNNLVQASFHSERSLLLAEKKEGKGLLQTVPVSHLGRAICYHVMGRNTQASTCLDNALSLCRRFKALQVEFSCHLARAEFALDLKDENLAVKSLKKALSLGNEQGYVNTYFWRSDVLSRLCSKALNEGIERAYVRKLIKQRNLVPDNFLIEIEEWPWPVRIFTLNGFRLFLNGTQVRFTRKAKHMPMALLKVLIALGGRDVSADHIADSLWPDSEGDTAHWSFATTLRRLRKLMGLPKAIQLRDKRLTIDRSCCCIDTWMFERAIEHINRLDPMPADGKRKASVQIAEKAIAAYKGHFLDDEAWAAPIIYKREQLRRSFLKIINWLGNQYETMNDWERAVNCYEYGLRIDEPAEEIYRCLMKCHQHLGQRAEALKIYDRCHDIMSAVFDSCPSPETETIRKTILEKS